MITDGKNSNNDNTQSCKSRQLYYRDKQLCAAKIITLSFQAPLYSGFEHPDTILKISKIKKNGTA